MKNRVVRLRDVASLNISNRRQNEKKIAYLDTGNIIENRVIKIQYFDYLDNIPSRAKRKVKEEDTIFSMVRPNQKHFGYINRSMENLIVSTGFSVVTPNKNKINSRYLFYLLTNNEVINIFQKLAEGCVSTYPTLSLRDLLDFEFKLPSLEEQKRIADILTALDDKIELNNQMNQTLEEIASLLYKRWFVDFEFPDDKGNPYKSSGGEMVDSELGMIPKGWEVKKLGEIELIITDFVSNGSFASLKANTKIYKEENYAVFVRNTDLKSGKFETYVDEKTYQFLSKSKLLGGEIIISNVGDVGSVFLCPRINKKMTLGNNVILVKSQESKIYWNYYLYIFLKSSLGKALLESITSGSAQMKFNKTDFKKLKFIAPNFNTLEEFNKIFDKNIFLQNNYKAENTKLQTMKKELLKELI